MRTQRHEVEAWLGDARADLTDDQVDEMHRLITDWEAEHADWSEEDWQDHADESAAEMLAIYERVTGELDLATASDELLRAKLREAEARHRRNAVLRHASAAGMGPSEIARVAGIDRMHVLRILGRR